MAPIPSSTISSSPHDNSNNNNKSDDPSKSTVSSARHPSQFDTARINRATERVADGGSIEEKIERAGDANGAFVDRVMASLQGLEFPAFKFKILEHALKNSQDPGIIGLFESLDGYTEYRDAVQVRRTVESNSARYKMQNQITDESRINPSFKTRPAPGGRSTKELEAVSPGEERKDYPEVTPTAMSNFVCDRCGKPFQNPQDLYQHQKFESGGARDVQIPGSGPPPKT